MKPLRNIRFSLSLILTLVFIAPTLGLSVDLHYCQGEVKRVSLIGKAKTCQEVAAQSRNCHHTRPACHAGMDAGDKEEHSGCCQNEQVQVLLDENLVTVDSGIKEHQHFQFTCPDFHHELTTVEDGQPTLPYLFEHPPIPDVPIFIRHCAFLC